VESGSYTTAEGTTGSGGCVVFTGLATTSATVEIVEKANFVTPAGLLKWPVKELTIAPNITTHYPIRYAEGGKIAARFTYKGATTWEGKEVTGDTFSVSNENIPEAPEFETGSTVFKYETGGEEHYTALTGSYAAWAFTPTGAKYAAGDLFPFSGWSAAAGDCHENAKASSEAPSTEPITVSSGKASEVKVPTSYVLLTVYTGTQASPGGVESTVYPVKITDVACEASATPNNAAALNITHAQHTTSSGHLEVPFQPFGKASLCVYNSTAKKSYTVSYTNGTAEGSKPNVYIGEMSEAEKVAKREKEESEAKAKREAEEAGPRAAREKSESELKAAREAEEKAKTKREKEESEARTTWKKEEEKKSITKAQREAKEKAQKEAREKIEAEEKTAKEKRKKEEEALAAQKTTEEETRKKHEKEEAELKAKRIKEESEEAAKKEVNVLSGVSSC
jgi:hypothetical protein